MNSNIRNKVVEELTDTMSKFVSKEEAKPDLRFYVGKIENNKDPDKLGRCKIRVFGIYGDDIPTNDIPWANPDFSFIGSTLGSFVVPPEDAIVRVYFEQDDIYRPMYTTKVVDRNNLSSEREEDYPNTLVLMETDLGDYFKINTSTGETTYRHASGLIISIDKNGNMKIDNTRTSTGNLDFDIKGNVNIKSNTGDVVISAPLGNVKLGGELATQPVNNLPQCLVTGAPHAINSQFKGTPGSVLVRP